MIASENTILPYRPHKGRTVNMIIQGLSNMDDVDSAVRNYVDSLMCFLKEENVENDIVLPTFFFEPFVDLSELSKGPIRLNVREIKTLRNIFHVEDGIVLIHHFISEEEKQNTNDLVEGILNSSFEHNTKLFGTYADRKKAIFKKNELDCFPDPSFIVWCIKNLPDFALDKSAINKTYKSKSLLTFETKPINSPDNNVDIHYNNGREIGSGSYTSKETVLYTPKFEEKEFAFTEKTKELNTRKLQIFSSISPSQKDYYKPSYSKYNGYNGYSDDVIDTAFEGDPNLTWNVD